MKFPPFPRGIIPELDPDTGLDLRAYSGQDSEDSLAGSAGTCTAVLADIPFDGLRSSKASTSSVPSLFELVPSLHETPTSICADEEVDRSHPTPRSFLEQSLSLFPTIPSIHSTPYASPASAQSPSDIGGRQARTYLHPVYDFKPSSLNQPTLRRQAVVYDLRNAFKLSAATTSHKHPAAPRASGSAARDAPHGRSIHSLRRNIGGARRAASSRRSGVPPSSLLSPPACATTPSAGWGFEQEITIALLAAVGEKPGVGKGGGLAGTPAAGAVAATVQCGGAAGGSGAGKLGPGARRRAGMRSVLRAVKGLVS